MTAAERAQIAAIFGALACEAGRAIMRLRPSGATARQKDDGSPVTQADLDADGLIRAGLARALPAIPVVTEELSESHALRAARFILVDPLDGTREFVAGRDEFTVNLALVDDGTPVVGAIYAPALGRLYLAGDGAHAADVPPDRPMPQIDAMQPLAAARVPRGDWRVVASRSHLDADTQSWLAARPVGELHAAGSSLKFCAVASGLADVYPRLSPTMEWDTAAGHAIVVAAGGAVVDSVGAALRYGKVEAKFRNPSFIAWGRRGEEVGS